jgi:hypothetical protein
MQEQGTRITDGRGVGVAARPGPLLGPRRPAVVGEAVIEGVPGGRIVLQEVAAGPFLRRIIGYAYCPGSCALALSADGRLLALGLDDGSVRIAEIVGGAIVQVFDPHPSPVTHLQFSANGCVLLSAHSNGTVRALNRKTGRHMRIVEAKGETCCCGLSDDGAYALSQVVREPPRHWETSQDAGPRFFGLWDAKPAMSCLAGDGRHALVSYGDGTLCLWDAVDGGWLDSFPGPEIDPRVIAIAPDGRHAAAATPDRTVALWDLASNEWGCLAVSHRECFPGLLPVDPALFTALEPIELLGLGGDPLRVLIYDGTGGGYDWRADLCDFSILQPLQLGHLPSAIAMSADTRTVIELVQIKETR